MPAVITNSVPNDEGIDYSDIEAKYQVCVNEGFDNVLFVDGAPIVDDSKLERLLAKMAKEFVRKGAPVRPDDFFVPWDNKTNKSKGYVVSP